jgi:hypothetical protein
MSDDKRNQGKRTSGLLGDLESIRSLLDETEDASEDAAEREDAAAAEDTGEADDSDEDVPLLEDVVHGGVSVKETFLTGQGDFTDSGAASGLNEEVFKALLSDEWRESARDLLDEARAAIEKYQTDWTPQHTDELNQALKTRIDETVEQWLRDVVLSRIDELRRELLQAVSEQIRIIIDEQFNPASTREDPDGE